MKTIILVGASAAAGVMIGDYVDEKLVKDKVKDAGNKKALRVGLQAASGTLVFALLSRAV